jgi:hypothetical protein
MEKRSLEIRGLANDLRVSRVTVWRALVGDRRPGTELAVAIEKELGIPVAAWTKRPRRPFVLSTVSAWCVLRGRGRLRSTHEQEGRAPSSRRR